MHCADYDYTELTVLLSPSSIPSNSSCRDKLVVRARVLSRGRVYSILQESDSKMNHHATVLHPQAPNIVFACQCTEKSHGSVMDVLGMRILIAVLGLNLNLL